MRAMIVAALLALPAAARAAECKPVPGAPKRGDFALTPANALVSVVAVSSAGVATIAFPKGGQTELPVGELARAVPEIGGLRVGDPVLDARPGGGTAVMSVRRLFSNCRAFVGLPRGGGTVLEAAALRRRFE